MKKKLFMFVFIILLGTTGFAEGETAELYVKTRIDFDLNESYLDLDPVFLGCFNVDRVRLGWKQKMSDVLTSQLELDVRYFIQDLISVVESAEYTTYQLNYEILRLASFDWNILEGITLSAGKMYEVFSPEYVDSRFIGAGLVYDFGMGSFAFQMGNDEGKNLMLMPALIIAPDPGDMSFEINVNRQLKLLENETVVNADAYVLFGIAGAKLMADLLITKYDRRRDDCLSLRMAQLRCRYDTATGRI